jgi:hypothetical protein
MGTLAARLREGSLGEEAEEGGEGCGNGDGGRD